MQINGGPSAMGLQHMAARAQEVRKTQPATTEPAASEISETGNNVPEAGENLPVSSALAQPVQQPDHSTGLNRAIESLEKNIVKSPEAKGLQQALEMLQRNLEKSATVDTQA